MAWNKVGAPQIEGWQGRYSLPLLPLVFSRWRTTGSDDVWPWLSQAALAFAVVANLLVILLLARATYGFA